MNKNPIPLKSSGNPEFDALAHLAAEAGFRVFPSTRQIVAADNASSGSAEQSLARFAKLVEARVVANILAKIEPEFEFVQDKRKSELTPGQWDDAKELWLRNQIGWFDEYSQDKLKFLLDRLSAVRNAVADQSPAD